MERNCLFCKIVAGEIPASIVASNELAIAFNDISPVAPTHLLVIPKAHYENVSALTKEDGPSLVALLELAEEVAAGADFRLVFNSGAGVGQSVFHAHGHVLAGRDFAWPPG
ncbi:MAG: HIT domain-containing protein [Actinobacteria bacterium]|jgi:histidine triad (HIT) family protein|nr:HIT domain-containing protein [Actinomycetota bacterium]